MRPYCSTNWNLLNQSEAFCDGIANIFSCIYVIILPYNREKATVSIFIIVSFAVNEGESSSIVFHNGFWIFATLNNTEEKLFFGVASVKETFDTHRLRRKHNSNMIVVGYFFQYVKGNVGINNHFFVF